MKTFLQISLSLLMVTYSILSYSQETPVSGVINNDITWTSSLSPYRVVGDITINSGKTLTIEPGVVVKFDSALSINVNGRLIANGTPTDSIKFTTSNMSPTAGQWKQIRFSNNVLISNLTYCIFEYGGHGNSSALQIIPTAKLFHHNNAYRNNRIQAIGIEGGNITIPDAVWYNDGIPYLVLGSIAIHSDGGDGKLKINPGAVVRFLPNTGIQVGSNYFSTLYRGRLEAIGKPDSIITFTSASGDNNDWGGLYFHNASDADGAVSYLEYCVIEKAGQNIYGVTANIYCERTNQPTIVSSIIQNSGGHGIHLSGSSTTLLIFKNKIHSNNVGIYCTGNANPLIGGSIQNGNEIYNNTNYGVQNTSSSVVVNAMYNWWGYASGPYHPVTNPNGLGNSVSDYVNYTDFNTPVIFIQPETIDFGSVRLNTTAVDSLIIRNNGTTFLHINRIDSENPEFGIMNQSATIAPSDSSIFYITFNPTGMGIRTTKLFVIHNALSSPDSLVATGIGIAPVFNMSQKSINFVDVGISFTKLDSIYIRNTGTYHLSIDSIYSTDHQFIFYPNTLTVAVGDSQKLYIAFQPANLGIQTGLVVFLHDGISKIDSLEVSGNGITNIITQESTPKQFVLYQNYPNPFNPATTIRFDLPEQTRVVMKIYDILGQEIRTLVNSGLNAGTHSYVWDGKNQIGTDLPSGIYLCRIETDKFKKTMNLLLLK